MEFATMRLLGVGATAAPDGSDVRVLIGLSGGGMAHFKLGPRSTSRAVVHRTVEEIWYVLRGHGEMWREQGDREEVVQMEAGVCLSLPVGTKFQFRTTGDEALEVIGVTMPPWPGAQEAVDVKGEWPPTL
jgi:mannose-6-phosphate isomerase-like protein (cupin superfamily)